MKSLIRFILRYHATFVFIILQIICISLIVSNNYYQRTVFSASSEVAVGKILSKWSEVNAYFHLKVENEKLLAENQKLKNLLEQRTAYSRNFEIDSSEVDFYYYKANVVSNSILKQNNFISVDIGQKHGIEKGMGVMGNDGIVGIVYNCSKNYSSIIPLINTDLQVSVKISSNNFMGSLSWSGADYRFANMSEVPLHVDIEIGDSIVTSGFSAIFPPNMPVGTIESYNEIKSLGFYEIKIKLFTDFAELRYVYIVDNKHKAEITELENENVK